MFESLSSNLEKAFKTLKGEGRITEINVAQTVKEIRKALVDADVNYKTAKAVTDNILKEALGRQVLLSVKPGELLTKVVYDELVTLMGSSKADLNLSGSPCVILIAGLQGSGKTTFSGKLARLLKSQGRQVLLAACDVYRPAAGEQLQVLGDQIGVEVYREPDNKNAVEIAKNALKHGLAIGKKTIIIDTAGRLAIDELMMKEVAAIKDALKPSETLFVVDSMTGQDAVNTARGFHDKLNFDGIVLTKLDGDTRGGAALTIRMEVNKPIKFVSNGEKLDALDIFYPDRMAGRILNMGDVLSLVERAQKVYDETETRKLNTKLRNKTFDYTDFQAQIKQIRQMGPMADLVKMIPGMPALAPDEQMDERKFDHMEAMILSMTPTERSNPDLLNGSRRKRIAQGSGRSLQEVNNFIKQFETLKKMMQKMMANPGKFKNIR